jgi:chorismate mutase
VTDPLESLRADIDRIDSQILELLAARVRAVLQVGDVKREHHLAVYDPERERRLIARLIAAAPAPLDADQVRRVFERIIDESRRAEQLRVQEPRQSSL